jgi:Mg-chelatase subunit ChlD
MQNLPDDNFYCPITYEIMRDPVIGPDGQTYERSAIESWLKTNDKSPLTKQIMKISDLRPNIALRNTIQQYLVQNSSIPKTKQLVPVETIGRNINIESGFTSDLMLMVRLNANVKPERKPSAFAFIIDVSGSMDSDASTQSTTGESDGLSRLDLVKHAVRTVIEVLDSKDMISIITFSDEAKLRLDFCSMTPEGKESAIQIVNSLKTENTTNIWDGLRVGLLNISKIKNLDMNIGLVLLTDGEPSVSKNPPRGIVPTLESTLESMALAQSFTINTFGFGYSLDSNLLDQIAKCGYGTYGYIPDSSMVGTIFVNYLSNVLSTYLSNSKIIIETKDKVLISENIGSISLDKPRELLYNLDEYYDDIKISLFVGSQLISSQEINFTRILGGGNRCDVSIGSIVREKIYSKINQLINKAVATKSVDEAKRELIELYGNIKMIQDDANPNVEIANYLLDWESSNENIGGQIKAAFSRQDWFDKWGKHFIRSIMNAYKNQQCNNFKDPGVQNFAGDLFKQIRTQADSAFVMLPPPTPSLRRIYRSANYSSAPVNMSTYYDRGGSCYDGNGIVKMGSGLTKKVKDLVKGDVVYALDKNSVLVKDSVRCIVKSCVETGNLKMCNINGLNITLWHPLKMNVPQNSNNPNNLNLSEWIFPINVATEKNVQIDWIYNVVLESGVSICINNLMMATLAHGLKDPIIAHEYYGTQKIIDDLSKMKGWNQGMIELANPMVYRLNGIVSQLIN